MEPPKKNQRRKSQSEVVEVHGGLLLTRRLNKKVDKRTSSSSLATTRPCVQRIRLSTQSLGRRQPLLTKQARLPSHQLLLLPAKTSVSLQRRGLLCFGLRNLKTWKEEDTPTLHRPGLQPSSSVHQLTYARPNKTPLFLFPAQTSVLRKQNKQPGRNLLPEMRVAPHSAPPCCLAGPALEDLETWVKEARTAAVAQKRQAKEVESSAMSCRGMTCVCRLAFTLRRLVEWSRSVSKVVPDKLDSTKCNSACAARESMASAVGYFILKLRV